MPLSIAIVGRPNVGKSTLFNRLTGKRHALVDDQPGITRDWREGEGHVGPLSLRVIDTAGLEEAASGSLEARMRKQTERAIEQAEVILLMVDGREGLTPPDRFFASEIRKSGKPMILLVNKAEGGKAGATLLESYALGFGEPVGISAEHGEGMADLYEALAPFASEDALREEKPKKRKRQEILPEEVPAEEEQEEDKILQIAIVGRPNVGKSTLINHILGEERVLTGPEAGLTRDAIAVPVNYEGRALKLVDTAGMRRKSNVTGKVEKLAVADSLRAIQYAHVVILLLDAEQALEKQDNAIAALIEREGRAVVIALNKWDKIAAKDKQPYLNNLFARLDKVLPQVRGVPVVPVSALYGKHVDKLLAACFAQYDVWNKRIGTGELNRWLEAALDAHNPPMVDGKRIKLRYMTQDKSRPPTFVLFGNFAAIPDDYLRYLTNSLRVRFDLPGVPVRMIFRKGKNPYEKS